MKAITLWQPWASLVATGAKKIETRGWPTKYRGPLAIHAAQKWNEELESLLSYWEFQGGLAPLVGKPLDLTGNTWAGVQAKHLPKSVIVCTCNLIDCIPTDNLTLKEIRHEQYFGDFTPGRFGWILDNIKPLEKPIPAKGSQGFWDWEGDINA